MPCVERVLNAMCWTKNPSYRQIYLTKNPSYSQISYIQWIHFRSTSFEKIHRTHIGAHFPPTLAGVRQRDSLWFLFLWPHRRLGDPNSPSNWKIRKHDGTFSTVLHFYTNFKVPPLPLLLNQVISVPYTTQACDFKLPVITRVYDLYSCQLWQLFHWNNWCHRIVTGELINWTPKVMTRRETKKFGFGGRKDPRDPHRTRMVMTRRETKKLETQKFGFGGTKDPRDPHRQRVGRE